MYMHSGDSTVENGFRDWTPRIGFSNDALDTVGTPTIIEGWKACSSGRTEASVRVLKRPGSVSAWHADKYQPQDVL